MIFEVHDIEVHDIEVHDIEVSKPLWFFLRVYRGVISGRVSTLSTLSPSVFFSDFDSPYSPHIPHILLFHN